MSRTKLRGGKNAALRRAERAEQNKTRNGDQARGVASKKRKLADDDNEQPTKRIETENASRPEQTEFDAVIAAESPEDLALRYREAIKKHKGDSLSNIELEDFSLPPTVFQDTTSFAKPHLVKNLAAFFEEVTPGGKEELSSCQGAGSPHTLLITSSAIRTTDLKRAVSQFGTEESKIAKLFAKHMKLNRMTKYVQETKFGIGAGTPQRIQQLIENEALKLERLQRIVLDASYIDDKKSTIFDHREAFPQILSLLNSEKLNLRLHSGGTKIVVF